MALSMLGVPKEDWDRLAELEHIMLAIFDPERVPEGQDRESVVNEAVQEVSTYFMGLANARRTNPGDDLISQLVHGVVQGEPLSATYAAGEAIVLLTGGLDTTRGAASAGGMLPVLERPDEQARLRANPAVLGTAVDEFVRWGSPIAHLARTVTAPAVIRNVDLHEGDRVVVFPHLPTGMRRSSPNRSATTSPVDLIDT